MRQKSARLGRGAVLRRLCLVAVLAPLSVAATVGLFRPEAGPGPAVLAVPAAGAADPSIPPLPQLPDAVEVPASVSQEPLRDGAGLGVVTDARHASVDAIPGRALTAYQRAETVIGQADASCHLGWELIAAIGEVESNHGQFGGALMTADGVVHPAILGPQLTGRGATSRIDDTDAGLIDGDQRFDRAAGPMQFIPSTWTVVGVDADGDGRRDPQDIDDASLATAVYLCSGTDDLATPEGQRAAVYRYNHSEAYVDLVLELMVGYQHADPTLFRAIGGSGTSLLDPGDYPTGVDGSPVPGDGQPTFDVVHPTDGPTPTAVPTGEPTVKPTSKPTATTTERPTPAGTPTAKPTPTPGATVPASPTHTPTDTTPSSSAPSSSAPSATATKEASPTETASPSETASPTETPTTSESPTGGPSEGPTDPGDPGDPGDAGIPQDLLDAWAACLSSGVQAADLVGLTTCLVDRTGRAADDPALLALLASPPVTPPAPTQTQQQPRVRRRRTV